MFRIIIIIPLLVILSSCQIFPSEYEFNSKLVNQQNGGQVCESLSPGFYSESAGDEVINVNFGGGLKSFDLIPEGNTLSESTVKWSKLSYSRTDTYAVLSKPDKLKIGEMDSLTGGQVCVSFFPGLFEDTELGLQNFRALSNQQCCGLLTKKEIERE